MKLKVSGPIGSWYWQDAYYAIWKADYTYKYVGMIRTVPKQGGLDWHIATINVYKVDGNYAPGFGSMMSSDPYSYLPRSAQFWEWNSNDQDSQRDKLGWTSANQWVELPKTAVPNTWILLSGSTDQGRVGFGFETDPNCWGSRAELRQGVTYEPASGQPPWDGQGSYQMDFSVHFATRPQGWWSCYGNADWYWGSVRVALPRL